MAVNTKSKRSAALRFGRAYLAGTRPPTGSINAFERSALLACYFAAAVVPGTPKDGWVFARAETVWIFGPDSRVFTFGD